MHIVGVKGNVSMYFIELIHIELIHFCVWRWIETGQYLVEHQTHQISDLFATAVIYVN